jgi:hypothetical protein
MATATKKKAGPWGVFEYEVMMYRQTSRPIPLPLATLPDILDLLKNVLTESRVLHARNLCDILLSHTNRDKDDVRLKELLPGFKSNHTKLLNTAYHGTDDEPDEERPHWIFNKMLAHPTTQRYDGWNYEPALTRLAPHITKLLQEIEDARNLTTSDAAVSTRPAPHPA